MADTQLQTAPSTSDNPQQFTAAKTENNGPYCVKTRGLPFDATKNDIADFLVGCKLLRGQEGIHLLVGVDGRSKGEAIVEFVAEEDVEKAQTYHMKSMGHRYIEVTPLSQQEKEWELSRQPAQPSSGDYVVRLRGLPWSASAKDIVQLLHDCKVANGEAGVHFTFAPDGRASGEAFVELCSEDDVSKAISHNNEHMGKRYVEIFRASQGQMQWDCRLVNRDGGGGGGFGGGGVGSGGVVRLRGLPFRCTEDDVRKFFQGLDIPMGAITLQKDQDGRETGEAYVSFPSTQDAEKALAKDRQHMGHRYIEVFRSTISEIKPILFRGGPTGRPSPYDRPGEREFDSFGRGERYGSGYERQYRGRGRGARGGGGGSYLPYDPYAAASFYEAAAVSEYFRPEPAYDEGAAYNSALAAQSLVTYPPIRPSQPGKAPSVSSNPQLKYMIRMRGLPFSAKDRDIETFFSPLVPIKINIDFDHYGRPSGEAEVFFASHKDAAAAMTKNNAHMGHRYIELFLNSKEDDGMRYPGVPAMQGQPMPAGVAAQGAYGTGQQQYSMAAQYQQQPAVGVQAQYGAAPTSYGMTYDPARQQSAYQQYPPQQSHDSQVQQQPQYQTQVQQQWYS